MAVEKQYLGLQVEAERPGPVDEVPEPQHLLLPAATARHQRLPLDGRVLLVVQRVDAHAAARALHGGGEAVQDPADAQPPPPHRRRALHFFLTPLAPTLYYYLYTSKAGKGVDDLLTWMGEDLASHLCARQMKAGCSGHGRHLWALRQEISERLVRRTRGVGQ